MAAEDGDKGQAKKATNVAKASPNLKLHPGEKIHRLGLLRSPYLGRRLILHSATLPQPDPRSQIRSISLFVRELDQIILTEPPSLLRSMSQKRGPFFCFAGRIKQGPDSDLAVAATGFGLSGRVALYCGFFTRHGSIFEGERERKRGVKTGDRKLSNLINVVRFSAFCGKNATLISRATLFTNTRVFFPLSLPSLAIKHITHLLTLCV